MDGLLGLPIKELEKRCNLMVHSVSYKYMRSRIYSRVSNGVIDGKATTIAEWYHKHVKHLLKKKGNCSA